MAERSVIKVTSSTLKFEDGGEEEGEEEEVSYVFTLR